MVNKLLSSLINKKSYGNYKRTQQEVSSIFLYYLYNRYIVSVAINNPTLMSTYQLWVYHEDDIL